jgi:hypothetical protein
LSVQAITADGWKLVIASATGPAAAVSVAAGASADIDLAIAANPANIKEILAFKSVTGLPDGIELVGISYPALSTVRVRVRNGTAAAITIAAGSVSASILARAA